MQHCSYYAYAIFLFDISSCSSFPEVNLLINLLFLDHLSLGVFSTVVKCKSSKSTIENAIVAIKVTVRRLLCLM